MPSSLTRLPSTHTLIDQARSNVAEGPQGAALAQTTGET